MPRPNRYHPYSRGHTAPPMPSPRYPAAPTLQYSAQPLPAISEHKPVKSFQYVLPSYIRGLTSDGTSLITRSILQGPDGMFHIQMEAVKFPSQCRGQTPPDSMPVDPRLGSMSSAFGEPGPNLYTERIRPVKVASHHIEHTNDDGSEKSTEDECAILSDDDDDENNGNWQKRQSDRAVMQQQRIIMNLIEQQKRSHA